MRSTDIPTEVTNLDMLQAVIYEFDGRKVYGGIVGNHSLFTIAKACKAIIHIDTMHIYVYNLIHSIKTENGFTFYGGTLAERKPLKGPFDKFNMAIGRPNHLFRNLVWLEIQIRALIYSAQPACRSAKSR